MASLQRSFSQYSKNRSPRSRSPQPTKYTQKTLKSGWLKKQGGNFKTWTNRWFVIRGDQMYYYQKDDEIKEFGAIPLPGNRVEVIPHNIDEPGKFLFEIVAGRGQGRVTASHDTYLIWAGSKEERDSWIGVIHRVIHATAGGGVFGQSLADTMMCERRRRTGRYVPKVVEDCVKYLRKNGMDTEGIFRLPGLSKTIKSLKWDYDTAINVDLFQDEADINSVASLLKLYFRELPEPVVPFQFYEMFLTMGLKIEHGDTRAMGTIHTLLDQLPVDNYNLLEYLCSFLKEVSQHSDQNKMPAMNLALVFGPNILKADIDDPTLLMSTTDLTTKTVFIFIEKHDEVFIREISEGNGHRSTENLLTANYNSLTLNSASSPLAVDQEDSTLAKRLSNSPLVGSLPRQESLVGDLISLDDSLTGSSSGNLLSPETGETKYLSDSDASCDSASIANRISLFEGKGSVAFRSGSESRRSRRSNQIEKCQVYVSQSVEPSSSERSPESVVSPDGKDGVEREVPVFPNSENGLSGKPVPPRRRNAKKNDYTTSKPMQKPPEIDQSVISSEPTASSAEFRPIAPKRPSKKKHRRTLSDATSEVSEASWDGDVESVGSIYNSCTSELSLKGALKNDIDSEMVANLMKTITSLEVASKEQEMKHLLQMNDMKQMYENKLKNMEDIFKDKINTLADSLIAEKAAREQTVDKIVGLQAELQKYQMMYGDLETAEEWKPL